MQTGIETAPRVDSARFVRQSIAPMSHNQGPSAETADEPALRGVRPGETCPTPPTAHRADIDGLRGVAVLGVILFHFGVPPFAGGYAGVDVFFVISGFLITSILDVETRQGRFSFVVFYERRVRRILPALLVVLAATACACAGLLPNDLKPIGLGLINAATFTSNLYFASLALDYFAAGALAVQPALHTWSLGLEIQFYLVFPPLWVAAMRWQSRWRAGAFAVLFAASFAASIWGVTHRPGETFYLLPTRLWEFMTGGAVVLVRGQRTGPLRWASNPAFGLGLIAIGFLALSASSPFPGLAALLPCFGAAAVVAGGANTSVVGRLLAAPPLAVAGRLSYSLYLWHWPILVFASYGRSLPLPLGQRLMLLGVTVTLSVLSWRFVERPIIERRWLRAPGTIWAASAVGVIGVAGLGLVVNLAGQNIIRITPLRPSVLTLADGQFDIVKGECRPDDQSVPNCYFGSSGVEPTVALWGNSFARMWTPALDAAARRRGLSGTALVLSRCPPLLGVTFATIPGCESFNGKALAFIDAHPALTTVILGGNWPAWQADLPALGRTVAALKERGRRVAVILSPPVFAYDVPRTLALAESRNEPPPPPLLQVDALNAQATSRAILDTLRNSSPFTLIDPFAVLCDGVTCPAKRDGRALYADEAHLTRFGAVSADRLFDGPLDGQPPTR